MSVKLTDMLADENSNKTPNSNVNFPDLNKGQTGFLNFCNKSVKRGLNLDDSRDSLLAYKLKKKKNI